MSDQFPPYDPSSGSQPEPPGPVYGEQPSPAYGSPPPPPPGVPYGQPYGAQQPPAYGQPASPYSAYGVPGQPAYGYQQTHSGASTAMILGIVSIVMALLNFFCCVTGVLSLGLGPAAIFLGLKAKREIDQQPTVYGNGGMAVAGLWTGVVGTVLGVLTVAFYLLFFGLVFSSGY